jgi:serine/threonine protein kinase
VSALGELSGLDILNMGSNELESLPADIFVGLNNLKYLDLSSNRLVMLPLDAFNGLEQLQTLFLNFNRLQTTAPGAFNGLEQLQILYLSSNLLSELEADSFESLSALSTLYLLDNVIVSLEDFAFRGLGALQELRLDKNTLGSLSRSAFAGLENSLEILYLSGNPLNDPQPQADLFADLSKLQVLNLVGTSVDCFQFAPLPNPLSLRCTGGFAIETGVFQVVEAGDEVIPVGGVLISEFGPANAIDRQIATKFRIERSPSSNTPEESMGFIVVPSMGAVVVKGLQFTSADDQAGVAPVGADPVAYELDCTLDNGTNYFNLAVGQILPSFISRFETTDVIRFSNNVLCPMYKLTFPPISSNQDVLQIGQVAFWGTTTPTAASDSDLLVQVVLPVSIIAGLGVLLFGGFVVRRRQQQQEELNDMQTKWLSSTSEASFKESSTVGLLNGYIGEGVQTVRESSEYERVSIAIESRVPKQFLISRRQLTIGKMLGGGSGGIVKQGKIGKSTAVAIKHIHHHMLDFEEGSRSNIQRELEILCSLHHPHCVAFYGFSYDDSWFLLVQELCSGRDLREAMKARPKLLVQNAHTFMVQIASGVEYLHTKNIVHRDIKAENVLLSTLDNFAVCKICDFGLSKLTMEVGQTTMTSGIGTVVYMAPELIEHAGCNVDTETRRVDQFKTDVYSTAILFAEILQPHVAVYKNMGHLSIIRAVVDLKQRPALPTLLPHRASGLITSMWDTNPSLRPDFPEILSQLSSLEIGAKSTGAEEDNTEPFGGPHGAPPPCGGGGSWDDFATQEMPIYPGSFTNSNSAVKASKLGPD